MEESGDLKIEAILSRRERSANDDEMCGQLLQSSERLTLEGDNAS